MVLQVELVVLHVGAAQLAKVEVGHHLVGPVLLLVACQFCFMLVEQVRLERSGTCNVGLADCAAVEAALSPLLDFFGHPEVVFKGGRV